MKRIVKFKGWNPDSNKWYFGDLVRRKKGTFISNYFDDTWGQVNVIVDPNTVSQFTGILDRFGNEIYENDIITYADTKATYLVVWRTDGWLAVSNFGDEWGPYVRGLSLKSKYDEQNRQISVIGNNHENSELLNNE